MRLENFSSSDASNKRERLASPFCFGWFFMQWPVIAFLLFWLTCIIYSLGLPGGFEFDDGSNIVANNKLFVTSLGLSDLLNAAFSSPAGPLSRPVAMVSFAINYYFFGLDASLFKVVNIVIHALNSVLILFLSRAVFRKLLVSDQQILLVSAASAALWAIAPINLSSVLYIVQRMTSLGALFALLSLILWMSGRGSIEGGRKGRGGLQLLISGVLVVVASLTKETYVLLFPCFLLMEWCLFQRNEKLERFIGWALGLSMMIAIVVVIVFVCMRPELILDPYEYRPFSLSERVFTQFRALCFYLVQIIFPSNISLGLYHDDFVVSSGLFQPLGTFAAFFLLLVLTLLALWFRKSAFLGLGVLWFFLWHAIESTIIGLELMHEHRNYLASLGIIWVLTYGTLQLYVRKIISSTVVLALFTSISLYWTSILALRAIEWSELVEHAVAEVMHHPESVRARYQLGRIHTLMYLESGDVMHLGKAEMAYREAAAISDYDLLPLFGLVRTLVWQKKPYEESLARLEYELANAKIPASTTSALDNYLTCIQGGDCVDLKEEFPILVKNAIENPTVKGRSRSQLTNVLASYYYAVEHNSVLAESTLKYGLQSIPLDFDLNKNLLYFYIVEGDIEKAMQVYRFMIEGSVRMPVDGRQQLDIACRKIKSTGLGFKC